MRERVGSPPKGTSSGRVATKRARVQVFDLTRVEKSCSSANSIKSDNFNKLLALGPGVQREELQKFRDAGVRHDVVDYVVMVLQGGRNVGKSPS